jgi:hypothetical protein
MSRTWLVAGICSLCVTVSAAGASGGENRANAAPKAVITNFSYQDTSSEIRNQTAEHAVRLKAFNDKLRADLSGTYGIGIVSLDCGSRCPQAESNLSALAGESARAGAAFVLIGGIHKTSTLVQWAKATIIDVRRSQPVYDRLVTFRGDSDEAWERAEAFMARDIGQWLKSQARE